MGGRGASYGGSGNIIMFKRTDEESKANKHSLWDSRGIGERLKQIEEFMNTSKRRNADIEAYRALKALDKTITAQLEDKDNDPKQLMTYRRKVRQRLKELTNKG